MTAKPSPPRVAFRNRNFGCSWMSPSPWLLYVHSLAGLTPVFSGVPRPATTPIGITMPTSIPRWASLVNPIAACSDGRTSVSTKNWFCWFIGPNVPLPFKTSGRRAYEVTRPNEKSNCPSTADEFTVTNPLESIAGRKISRSSGAFVSWACAEAARPVMAAMMAAWTNPRRGRAIMNTSGRTGAPTSGPTEPALGLQDEPL